MTGRSQIWDGAQWINLSNNPGSKGETGETGPPGDGGGVSQDPGNQAVLGTDSLVYVPDFADGVYLQLTGGTMTGRILLPNDSVTAPALSFADDTDTGMFRLGSDHLGFTIGGEGLLTLRNDFLFIGDGTTGLANIRSTGTPSELNPTYTFQLDADSGMYRAGANELGFSVGGAVELTISTTLSIFEHPIHVKNQIFGVTHYRLDDDSFRAQPVFDGTAGAAGNVFVTTGGVLLRSLALAVATEQSELTTMNARTGESFFDNSLEAIDLAAVVNYILDRIDALEAFHP